MTSPARTAPQDPHLWQQGRPLTVPAGRWRWRPTSPTADRPLHMQRIGDPLPSPSPQWWWVVGWVEREPTPLWTQVQVHRDELVRQELVTGVAG